MAQMTMIERVAKAIDTRAKERGHDVHIAVVHHLAGAAIEAMREPTGKMIGAALDAHDRAPKTTRVVDDWQVMIDAALKE